MEWLHSPDDADATITGGKLLWRIFGVISAVLVAVLVAWWKGFLKEYLPRPKRVVLALKNVLRCKVQASEERFRIVLCWLGNDSNGDNTGNVEEAFTSVEGVTLVRSARM